jgi:hypothetical protein
MKTTQLTLCAAALAAGLGTIPSARAGEDFHFPVGIAYSSGIADATDKLADLYRQDGYSVSKIDVPLGLVLNPYYEWHTSIGGIGAGVTVGPTAFVVVDHNGGDNFSGNTQLSYAVPVGPFIRYTPWPKATISPYVRAGVTYTIAGGNFDSSGAGGFGAVGVELWRTKRVGVSLEAGYDSSRIKVTQGPYSGNVSFPGFTVSLQALF